MNIYKIIAYTLFIAGLLACILYPFMPIEIYDLIELAILMDTAGALFLAKGDQKEQKDKEV